MDVQFPYAEGIARQHLMYRLPLPAGPLKVLQMGGDAGLACMGPDWPGTVQVVPAPAHAEPPLQSTARFDVVALPASWDAPGSGDANVMLGHALNLLAPGGTVVGHCAHLMALRGLTSLSGLWRALRSPVRSGAACRRALEAAGFRGAECFYVQPTMPDPMGLIPIDRVAARAQFLRAVRAEQGHFGSIAYAARIVVSQVGLGGLKQSQLFFWARKPC